MPQLDTETQPALTNLVGGIVHDAQELMSQQLKLFQVELKNDLRRTKEASIPLLIGMMVSFVGLIVLAIGGGFLLSWNWPELPLWGGLAIVGGGFALIGGALVLWGKSRFDAFNPLPDETVRGLRETIQWKTKT